MMMLLVLAVLYWLAAASFYLSGCKASQETGNQTGGVVRLPGNKQSNCLTGTGRAGDWLAANCIA